MATFPQWLERYPENKRLVYICGEDRALVEFVLKEELRSREISDLDFVMLTGKDKSVDIMSALEQFAKPDNQRLIVIRESDKIKKWEPVMVWCESPYMRQTSVICIGDEVNPKTTQDEFAYLRPFITKGRFVECKSLTEEQLIEFIGSRFDVNPDGVKALVEITSGNTFHLLNELQKLQYLGATIDSKMVRTYVEPLTQDLFIDALLMGDKVQAVKQAERLALSDYGRVIGSLEYILGNLILLLGLPRSLNAQDIKERTGIPVFLLTKYWKYLRGVNMALLFKRVKLLANLDAEYRDGNIIAGLERMVRLW